MTQSDNQKNGAANRRDEIIAIAADLFAVHGFRGTTIRDIAAAAGILSGSLYYHFPSKESIAEEILAAYWSELFQRYDEVLGRDLPAEESLRELIRVSLLLMERHNSAMPLILNDWYYLAEHIPGLTANIDRVQAVWTRVVEAGIAEGAFDDRMNPVVVYRTIMSTIYGTARWYRPGRRITIEELSDTVASIFLTGVTRPARAVSNR